jgi:hypothetical protein
MSMANIDKVDWEILNATADDWENLEQIYRAVCFEVYPEKSGESGNENYLLRPVGGAPTLEELADRIHKLVADNLLIPRFAENENLPGRPDDLWRGWFQMSSLGRKVWSSSEHTASV